MADHRFAPTDGGDKGWEWRPRWTLIRVFSWTHGFAGRRFPHTWLSARWSLFSRDAVLVGVETFKDEDGHRIVNVGLWPLRVEVSWCAWERPDRQGGPRG